MYRCNIFYKYVDKSGNDIPVEIVGTNVGLIKVGSKEREREIRSFQFA